MLLFKGNIAFFLYVSLTNHLIGCLDVDEETEEGISKELFLELKALKTHDIRDHMEIIE